MYVRTDKGDAICPPPIINGGGIKTLVENYILYKPKEFQYPSIVFLSTDQLSNKRAKVAPNRSPVDFSHFP